MICMLESLISIFNSMPHTQFKIHKYGTFLIKKLLLWDISEKTVFKRSFALQGNVQLSRTYQLRKSIISAMTSKFCLPYIVSFLKETKFKKKVFKTTKVQTQESGNALMMDS